MTNKPILIQHANELITVAGGSEKPLTKDQMNDLHIIIDGALWLEDGKIEAVGKTEEIRNKFSHRFYMRLLWLMHQKKSLCQDLLIHIHTLFMRVVEKMNLICASMDLRIWKL